MRQIRDAREGRPVPSSICSLNHFIVVSEENTVRILRTKGERVNLGHGQRRDRSLHALAPLR